MKSKNISKFLLIYWIKVIKEKGLCEKSYSNQGFLYVIIAKTMKGQLAPNVGSRLNYNRQYFIGMATMGIHCQLEI